MRLELNGAGRIVIRDITPDALRYIEEERQMQYDPHGYWYFGTELYDGSLYVNGDAGSAKILQYIDVLVKNYGMQIDDSMNVVLNNWKRYADLSKAYDGRCEVIKLLSRGIVEIQKVLRDGCRACEKFIKVRNGDDLTGYCVQGNTRTLLDESPLSWRHGEFGNDGVHYMGQKFYPHEGCDYLKGEMEWKGSQTI